MQWLNISGNFYTSGKEDFIKKNVLGLEVGWYSKKNLKNDGKVSCNTWLKWNSNKWDTESLITQRLNIFVYK